LLDAHRDDVYRFLTGMVGPHEADDCFQETFLSALRAYPAVRDDGNLRAWLMTIAYSKAMDSHRARRRRPAPTADVPDRASERHAGHTATEERALWDAVRALPPMQRAAIVQRYANDLPYAQIARVIGCSEAAARQNVREGLKKLKEATR
jgi:RNA polymerase sigma factor (sigma-70 family)